MINKYKFPIPLNTCLYVSQKSIKELRKRIMDLQANRISNHWMINVMATAFKNSNEAGLTQFDIHVELVEHAYGSPRRAG